MKYEPTKETDKQLLSLMTHVQSFLKGRLTLSELGEAEERAEIFRTNQVTNYDQVSERVNSAQIERENAELQNEVSKLRKKHEDALKLMGLVMTQPTDISVALANAEREKWVQCDQLEELRKDKERLDWLIDNASISMLRKDEDGEEWWVELDYSEARNDIDKQMKEAQ